MSIFSIVQRIQRIQLLQLEEIDENLTGPVNIETVIINH